MFFQYRASLSLPVIMLPKKSIKSTIKSLIEEPGSLRAIPFEILRGGGLENFTDPRPHILFLTNNILFFLFN